MAKKKGLPKTIFVERKEHNEEEWLEPVESVEQLAVIGKTKVVGVYQLVTMQKIKGVVEIV